MSRPSTSHSLSTPLLADDSPSDAVLSPPPSSHAVHIDRHCLLWDVPPPLRSMMLDYMDDRTAIRYLNTCQSLHAGYHQYPLKCAMAESLFREVTQLDAYLAPATCTRTMSRIVAILLALLLIVAIPIIILLPWPQNLLSSLVLGFFCMTCWACCGGWPVVTRRKDCCTHGRLGVWRRRYLMPRVIRLSDQLWDMRLLPYLRHLTELTITCDDKHRRLGNKYRLPQSLHTLRLNASPRFTLTADMLPPRLTSLSLSAIKNTPLPVRVLPASLTSLHLTAGFDTRWAIGAGVLPANLQQLDLDEWSSRISIALPTSLTELDVRWLSNDPLPVLPPQLQVLRLGGAFNQPLTGVLPPSLRVLELIGHYGQPFTADVFESTPVLEELWLSDRGTTRVIVASLLPRSLRLLRVGRQYSLVMAEASELPPQLRRLIVPAEWDLLDAGWVTHLQQLGRARGFSVVLQ